MPTYRLNLGEPLEFDAQVPSAFLDAWRGVYRTPASDPDAWRRQAALLASDWSGKSIRFESDEAITADMMRHGLLEEIDYDG